MSKLKGKQVKPIFIEEVHAPSIVANVKHFNIQHPSKPDHRLVHTCIEGPENGVYSRGKSQERKVSFPYYWKDLVDESTITVHVTAIGKHELYIESVDVSGFEVCSDSDTVCFFWVAYAERKDIPALRVEYPTPSVERFDGC